MRALETEYYRPWINSLADRVARARIQVRVDRLVHGNPGKQRNLAGGISEFEDRFRSWLSRLLHPSRARSDCVAGLW